MLEMYKKFLPSDTGMTHPLTSLVRAIIENDAEDIISLMPYLSEIGRAIPEEHRDGVAAAVYQPGKKRILVVRRRGSLEEKIFRAIRGLVQHRRFKEFSRGSARIQIDFFGFYRHDVNLSKLAPGRISENRFEFGVDGLVLGGKRKNYYFLPGDSYVRSIYSKKQLGLYLKRLLKKESGAVSTVDQIRSTSIVEYQGEWIHLYRGHPAVCNLSSQHIEKVCEMAINHIVNYQRNDKKFLYYYDAGIDSERNHDHPKRDPVSDPYYNELRHAGGIVTLMLAHQRGHRDLREVVEDKIGFIIDNILEYKTSDGKYGCYVYYNRKSKLGGAGLALYVLSMYQLIFGDDRYAKYAGGIFNHIVDQITESGEFMYYNVYLDKLLSVEDNKNFFSFYYPGEALIGMAAFLKYVGTDEKAKQEAIVKIKKAIKFLLIERPVTHASHYSSLPSDAWLMAAINELWGLEELQDHYYAEFVFNDADKMISHMYDRKNALFPDYEGAFYYQYGDLPYPDGARLEGLVAALDLAVKVGDEKRGQRYIEALIRSTRATIRLVNTPESLYFAPNPEKALGGIRFKLTRQWFRIDTIQHVVCYYYRFLDIYYKMRKEGVDLEELLDDVHENEKLTA